MIIVRCFGGLGNQMFQYCFYKYIELDNDDVFFDISDFEHHNHHNGYELENVFGIKEGLFCLPQKKKVAIDSNSLIKRILRKSGHLSIEKLSEINEERIHSIIVQRTRYSHDIYFNGYWQNAVYAESLSERIRSDFTFANALNPHNMELVHGCDNRETVGIHIRCGDYINNSSVGGICDIDYYHRAIDFISNRIDNPLFIVFSDDPDWVLKNLDMPFDHIIVSWNKANDSWQDMKLMSMCSHNIIANSSFSWWAAWLNNNPNKIVVMPQKWYNSYTYNPLKIDKWITI